MPRIHRCATAIDPDETELLERARAAGVAVYFNTRALHAGEAHILLFEKRESRKAVAAFKRCRAAITWIDEQS